MFPKLSRAPNCLDTVYDKISVSDSEAKRKPDGYKQFEDVYYSLGNPKLEKIAMGLKKSVK
jgi:hypothetical protein